MSIVKDAVTKYILILLLVLGSQALLAAESAKDKSTYLNVAKTQLNSAFDNYSKGNIAASKRNLKHASEWLHKAVQHSQSDIVKIEAKKLAVDIDSFRSTLNKSSEKNDMARFWHQVATLIKRESEHLIHSYTESSINSKILRYLLDARMHFYIADHDLFVSHDSKDANLELSRSLDYLAQAQALSKSKIKSYVNRLITGINELISLSELNKQGWKDDTLIHSIDSAINNINDAESFASPPVRLQLELIKQSISRLKKDALKTSLKVKYDSIKTDFSHAINDV